MVQISSGRTSRLDRLNDIPWPLRHAFGVRQAEYFRPLQAEKYWGKAKSKADAFNQM